MAPKFALLCGFIRVSFLDLEFVLAMASSPPSKRRRKNLTFDDAIETLLATSSSVNKLSPVVVFAHGAGAPSSSEWMIRSVSLLLLRPSLSSFQFSIGSGNFFIVLASPLIVSSRFLCGVCFC